MQYRFKTSGVCSSEIILDVDDDGVISHADVIGGCNGNLQGVCRLIEGRQAAEVADKLQGIICGHKSTSCPDQLSRALRAVLANKN